MAEDPNRDLGTSAFEVSPTLLAHVSELKAGRFFCLYPRADRPPVIVKHPHVLAAISALPQRFSKADALQIWDRFDLGGRGEQLWDALVSTEVILSGSSKAVRYAERWSRFNWDEAFLYHWGTRDYPFVRMNVPRSWETDAQRMRSYTEEGTAPDCYYQADALLEIALPPLPENTSKLESQIAAVARNPRSRDGLSILLGLAFGERGHRDLGRAGKIILKAVPSGGGRHPTEAFLGVFDCPDIPVGCYHYCVQNHSLRLVTPGDVYEPFSQASFDLFLRLSNRPWACVVLTSLVHRAMWRYREPRSARAILVDAGHCTQLLRRACDSLGLSHYSYQKLRDAEIAELCRVHPAEQVPLLMVSLV